MVLIQPFFKNLIKKLLLICLFISYNVCATEKTIETSSETFRVHLGATRVIYSPSSSGATLRVSNPQSYPIVISSKVLAEDKKSPAPFIITPPLFRLNEGSSSRIRITQTGGTMPEDRESLFWICTSGIPPIDTAGQQGTTVNETSVKIQLSISTCIRLLYRPDSLMKARESAPAALSWSRQDKTVVVTNPSPYYLTFASVKVNGSDIKAPGTVEPFSTKRFSTTLAKTGSVEWRVQTDLGGETKIFSSNIK